MNNIDQNPQPSRNFMPSHAQSHLWPFRSRQGRGSSGAAVMTFHLADAAAVDPLDLDSRESGCGAVRDSTPNTKTYTLNKTTTIYEYNTIVTIVYCMAIWLENLDRKH